MCGVHLAIKFKCERYKVPYNIYNSLFLRFIYILKVCTWVYSCTADTIRQGVHIAVLLYFKICVSKICKCAPGHLCWSNLEAGTPLDSLKRSLFNLHALFFIRHPRPPHLFIYIQYPYLFRIICASP